MMEIRTEDLAKKLLADAPAVSKEVLRNRLKEYIGMLSESPETHSEEYLRLYGRGVGYTQVFRIENGLREMGIQNVVDWLMGYLEESAFFTKENEIINMSDVREIQGGESPTKALELWIGTEYFQLSPFGWGVEVIKKGEIENE